MSHRQAALDISIRLAADADRARWDAFVDAQDASFYHYFAWRSIYRTGRAEFLPLLAESSRGDILGIFPLVADHRRFFTTLASLPVSAYGRPITASALPPAQQHELTDLLLAHAEQRLCGRCATFVVKDCPAAAGRDPAALAALLGKRGFRLIRRRDRGLPCTHLLDLTAPVGDLRAAWGKGLRYEIRRAEREGLRMHVDHALTHLDAAVEMFRATYRWHGTPPPAADDLRQSVRTFGDQARLHIGLLDGTPRFAMLCYCTPTTCYISKTGYRGERAPHFKRAGYSHAIADACAMGLRTCEFGVTNTAGQAFFKGRFGVTPQPIHVYEKICSLPRAILLKAPLAWRLVNARLAPPRRGQDQ